MSVRIDRRARRHLKDSGGVLTVEARARTGCMVTREVEARPGKPEDPGEYDQLEVGGVTVFVRATLEHGDGSVHPTPGALPRALRVGARDGRLTVDVV